MTSWAELIFSGYAIGLVGALVAYMVRKALDS